MSIFQQAKIFLVEHLDLAKDALHIYVALAAFFGACFVFRWKASQVKPLLVVLAAALAGEIWDARDTLAAGWQIDWTEAFKDIANTLLVPAIIVLLARYTRVFR
jgi:hypothetical protein